jgi:peptidyl-prolyl cis-trans isomerase SurA
MNRRARAIASILALTILVTTPAVTAETQLMDGVAAVVNGKVITRSEVNQAIGAHIGVLQMEMRGASRQEIEARVNEIKTKALQDLIDRELILDEFKEKGGVIRMQFIDESVNDFIRERFEGDRSKFIEELRKTGLTLQQFRKMREESLVVQYMRGSQVQDTMPATPIQRERIYKENIDRFRGKDYVRLRTITIEKNSSIPGATPETQQRLTEEIRTKIIGGSEFASLAKAYSIDSKASNGGDWGTIERGDLKTLLSDTAFALKPLTVSDVVEDDRNYYLLWVDAVQRGEVTPLSEVREQVDQLVIQAERKATYEKWISRLREKSNISVPDSSASVSSSPAPFSASQPAPAPRPTPVVSTPPSLPSDGQGTAKPADEPEEKPGLFKRMLKKLPGI